jgi:uncharacterized membrane protein
MISLLLDWLDLFLRWAHVILGIGWIGTSFFFVWLDQSLRAAPDAPQGVAGESWMVHGGGFYRAQKYTVAPPALPKELHWFKYEAYFTWVTGFLLLVVVYYVQADALLIDPRVHALTPLQAIVLSAASLVVGWFVYDRLCRSPLHRHPRWLALAVFALATIFAFLYGQIFSGRAAFLHVGAVLGTIMSANVFFVIIPNQRKTIAALIAGQAPDPALGHAAKLRSLHNNYLTLPVVLAMVSSHYPMLFEQPYSWLFAAAVIVIGALVRHFYNLRDAGRTGSVVDGLLVYAAGVAVVLVVVSLELSESATGTAVEGPPAELAEVVTIIENRCLVCHSAEPADASFPRPPKGIAFDTPAEIERYADQILRVTVRTHAMPLANRTAMTEEERALIGRWAANAGAARSLE